MLRPVGPAPSDRGRDMVSGTGRARAGVGPGPVRSAQTWPGGSRDRFRSCTGGPGRVPVPDPFVHTGPGGVPVPSRLWVRGAGTGPGPVRANVAGAGESRYWSGSCTRGRGEVSEPARFVSTWLGGVGVPVRGHGAGGRSGSRVGVIHGAGPSTRGWGGSPRSPRTGIEGDNGDSRLWHRGETPGRHPLCPEPVNGSRATIPVPPLSRVPGRPASPSPCCCGGCRRCRASAPRRTGCWRSEYRTGGRGAPNPHPRFICLTS